MIGARMRVGASWVDVCILNISPRGLGMQCAVAPTRGSYVEVRRGAHVMIGCVAWSNGHRFGLRTQDLLVIDTIIREPDKSASNDPGPPAAARPIERRARPRTTQDRHDGSRTIGRALEFACVAVFGISAALVVFQSVAQALGQPLAQVSSALESR